MTQREFTKICKDNGFARVAPNIYARCVGDGVLQKIDTSRMEYITENIGTEEVPIYCFHQKSKYITFGFSSLYTKWDECCFQPDRYPDLCYAPSVFVEKKHSYTSFLGFDDHCRIMQEAGFSRLNEITTQDALLNAKADFDRRMYGTDPANGQKWVHTISVAEPLMVCQRWDEAMYEVCRHYTHSRESFHHNYDSLKVQNDLQQYYLEEERYLRKLEDARFLWHVLLVMDKVKIESYLQENLARNTEYAKKYGIPFI